MHDALAYLEGDLFRLIALYNYGGIYVDADVILLRDWSPLLYEGFEFLYDHGWHIARIGMAPSHDSI